MNFAYYSGSRRGLSALMEEDNRVLVLTRRANQSIMIGHDVVVTVLEVRGDQVRLGIKAPREIDVHREEVFAALQLANRQAASPSDDALKKLAEAAPGKKPAETK